MFLKQVNSSKEYKIRKHATQFISYNPQGWHLSLLSHCRHTL